MLAIRLLAEAGEGEKGKGEKVSKIVDHREKVGELLVILFRY